MPDSSCEGMSERLIRLYPSRSASTRSSSETCLREMLGFIAVPILRLASWIGRALTDAIVSKKTEHPDDAQATRCLVTGPCQALSGNANANREENLVLLLAGGRGHSEHQFDAGIRIGPDEGIDEIAGICPGTATGPD